jgi:hypothetical protein
MFLSFVPSLRAESWPIRFFIHLHSFSADNEGNSRTRAWTGNTLSPISTPKEMDIFPPLPAPALWMWLEAVDNAQELAIKLDMFMQIISESEESQNNYLEALTVCFITR